MFIFIKIIKVIISSKLRKDILHNKTVLSIIDIGAYFSDVRGEQIIITIKNSYTDNNVIEFKKLQNNEFIDCCKVKQNFFFDEIVLFKNYAEYSIYCKLENTYEKFGDLCTGYVGRGKSTSDRASELPLFVVVLCGRGGGI